MWIDVADAARELSIDGRHVRRLVASGELSGRRVGGVWLIDRDSVRDRQLRSPRAGRPLSEPMAWAAAALLARCLPDAGAAPDADVASKADAVLPALDRRMQRRLLRLLGDPPPVEHWPQWMRNLSDRRRVRIHPGLLDRFADDTRVRSIDPSPMLGVGGVEQRFYVDAADLPGVLADYRAKSDPDGPVELHVFHDAGADALRRCPDALAVAAAVDLVASPNARERHAARSVLCDAVRKLGVRQP